MKVPWLPMPMLTVLPAAAPELGPGTGYPQWYQERGGVLEIP